MFRFFILFATVSLVYTSTAADEKQKIPLPDNYRETFTNYLSLDRLQDPDQIIRLFANDIAMQGPGDDGKLPYGSILVGEIYKARLDSEGEVITSSLGRRIIDRLTLIAVMQREEGWGTVFPEAIRNGNWEYAAYNPDGSKADKDLQACAACHVPLVKTNFLFSYEHLIKQGSLLTPGPARK